jgi:hypothetical protein
MVTRSRSLLAVEPARTEGALVVLSLLALGLMGGTGFLAARGVRTPAKRLAAAARRSGRWRLSRM